MKIDFKLLTLDDIAESMRYFRACKFNISDYSAAFKFMWQDYFAAYYAVAEGCIIFKEFFQGRTYFHYPMYLADDGSEDRALDVIERYCKENAVRLHYTSVPEEKMPKMIERYGADMRINNKRRWRDYLYSAQEFADYSGKKYAGQRNHVNKFKRMYPGYRFVELGSADSDRILRFLDEFEKRQIAKGTVIAREEMKSVYALVKVLDALQLKAGGIEVDGEMISFSVGESCGEQLIVHVEKALTQYDGIYATTAQEFARHFACGAKYINREDDAGDPGLRKSKLQYNPLRLVDKFNVYPRRAIDAVSHYPHLAGERVVLREVADIDAADLFRLECDDELNRYWGYSWREHHDGEPRPEYFLNGWRDDFKNKEEMPFGVFLNGVFVGEAVLHNFGYRAECEIGVRLLKEFWGMGLARESLLLLMRYAFFELDIQTIHAKCFKPNLRSRSSLISAGMRECGEDDVYFYFYKTAAM